MTGTQAANSITFQSSGAQTLSGGTAINLDAGGLVGSQYAYGTTNRGTVTISSPISLTSGQSWINNGTNAMTVSGAVSGSGNLTIQNNAAGTTGTFTISTGGINHTGTIANSGSGGATTTISAVVGSSVTGITQNAANGTLTLSGANTAYVGTTTLTSGTLNVIHSKALGAGSLVINGGALNSTVATPTLSNTAITGASSANGSTVITSIPDTSALALGQFVYGTGIATGAYITAIVPNTSITVSTPNTAGISGTLTFGALVPQTWAGDFAFTGTANLNLGSGAISLGANAGATRTVTVNANILTVGGAISNGTHGTTPTVNLAKAGAGTLTIYGTNVLGYTGSTTVSAGTLIINGSNPSYTGATTVDGGTLRLGNPFNANVLEALGSTLSASNIALNSGTLQLRANGSTGSLPQTIVAGNNVTVGANAATIDVGNYTGNSGHTITLGSLTLGTGQLNTTSSNSYTLSFTGAASTLTGNATFNPTTGGCRISGVLGESGGGGYTITKIGSGTLTLAGAHTFTGPITVLAGTLGIGANAPSGTAGSLGNATSAVLVGDTTGSTNTGFNIAGDFSVGRNIVVQGGNSGVVTIGSTSVSVNSSTISGDIALGSGGLAHNAVFNSGDYHQMVYSGIISGTGGITTIGGQSTSRVIINGNNTFSGGTTMTGGVLRVGHNNALGTGTITINGGTLGTGTAGISLANNQIWAGNFGGGISTYGGGGTALTTTGTNTITGGTRTIGVNNVDWIVNGTIADGGNNYGVILKNASTDNVGANISLGGANTFGGGLMILGSTKNLTVTTSTSTAVGSGQTTLVNATGSILKLAAPLSVDSLTSAIATPTFTGGTGGTNGTPALVFTGGGGTGAAGTATISGGIITAVTITNYGKNYTSAPTIELSTPGGTGTITTTFGSSSVNLQANTLTLSGTNASPATYAGIISGTGGSLVKNGSGTQFLTGANTYTGTTDINAGSLVVNGSLGATAVSVNSTGTLSGTGSFGGSVTVASGGHLAIGVAADSGSQVPLQIAGALTLDGGNILDLTATPTPAAGVYTLATAAGGVTYTTGPVNFTGGSGVVSASGNNLILTVGAGVAGYAAWANTHGIPGEPASGDFDKDGLSNFVEYALGLNPTVSSQSPGTLTGKVLTFTKGSDAITNNDVIFEIEESTDLGITDPWVVAASEGTADDTPDISYDLATGGSLKHFARLKVIQVP